MRRRQRATRSLDAWAQALACDSVSAFGGIVAANRPLDGATAEAIAQIFTEVVVAPDADADARAIFAKKKNLRLLLTGELPDPARGGQTLAVIAGGLLVQDRDNGRVTRDQLKCVTKRQPTEQEIADCLFAWTVAKHVKSNAIVYAKDGATAGIGAGQMNRRDSARIAAAKARRSGARPTAGPSRARSARRSRRTPSSRSPTGCSRRSKPAPPRSSSPAARSATTKSSPPPTPPAWRCCSPACATSGTNVLAASRNRPGLGGGTVATPVLLRGKQIVQDG